jgi:hypothetical protein
LEFYISVRCTWRSDVMRLLLQIIIAALPLYMPLQIFRGAAISL